MGTIKRMCELLRLAGKEIHDQAESNSISPGRGFTRDDMSMEEVQKRISQNSPDFISTNSMQLFILTGQQPPKPVDDGTNVSTAKPRSRPKKKVNAVHKSKRLSLFDIFQKLTGGKR